MSKQQPLSAKKPFVNIGLLAVGSIVFLLGVESATYTWFTEVKTGSGSIGGTGFAIAFIVFPLLFAGIELIVHSFFPGRPNAKLVLFLAVGSIPLILVMLFHLDQDLVSTTQPYDLINFVISSIGDTFLITGVLLGIEGLIRLMIYLVRLAIPSRRAVNK